MKITAGRGLQPDRQRLVIYLPGRREGGKKRRGPREHVENRGEIPASISPDEEGIKGDRTILELADHGLYFGAVCILCTLFLNGQICAPIFAVYKPLLKKKERERVLKCSQRLKKFREEKEAFFLRHEFCRARSD